jgi:hypothetical protein
MSAPAPFSAAWWDMRCVEPVKRRCAGRSPAYVSHRFPIKGGLPRRVLLADWRYALLEQAARPSFFASMLAAKRDHNSPIVKVDLA